MSSAKLLAESISFPAEESEIFWFISDEKVNIEPVAPPPSSDDPNAASILPQVETKRSFEWKALSPRDSLRLERGYREALRTGEFKTVTINGELYEVDLRRRLASPIYWHAPPKLVLRGTWYYDGEPPNPCEEAVAQEIERHYQKQEWKDNFPFRVSLPNEATLIFFSESEIRFYPNDVTTKLALLLKREKNSGSIVKRAPIKPVDFPPNYLTFEKFSHLVFVVHGIGNKIEQFDIVNDVNEMRSTVNNLLRNYYEEDCAQSGVQLLPVQWRKDLDLPHDMLDSDGQATLGEITLESLQGMRNMLNGTFIDVLLYMTPNHRDKIHMNVVRKMNELYNRFISRHPDFLSNGGKVSILGHSLGSVITFDLLCHQYDPTDEVDIGQSRAEPEVNDTTEIAKLKKQLLEIEKKLLQLKYQRGGEVGNFIFPVNHLFLLGSPLSVFLTLRGDSIHPNAENNVFPKVEKLYNVFHPYDPIAYRVEPLVCKRMAKTKPAYVPYYRGGNKFHIEMQVKKEDLVQKTEEIKKNVLNQISSIWNMVGPSISVAALASSEPPKLAQMSNFPPEDPEKKLLEVLGDGRIDYVIQDDFLENPLLGAVLSHLSYWKSDDTAMFILRRLLQKEGKNKQ